MSSPGAPPSRRSAWIVVVVVVGVVVALLVVALVPSVRDLLPSPSPGPNPANFPIRHFVFVIMENHAFDNYFGAYCPTTGPYCTSPVNGIPPGVCMPDNPRNGSTPCTAPFPLPFSQVLRPDDMQHSWQPSHVAYDGGAMDGFVKAERNLNTMGYYNASELPVYWDLAENFGLGDDFFSSTLSYSLPNHWYLLAGQSPGEAEVSGFPSSPSGGLTPEQQLYLNQANQTRAISDILVNSSLSWKYYDYPLQRTYNQALSVSGSGGGGTAPEGPFNYWDPLAAKAESYGSTFQSHFVNVSDFFNDSRAGTLPNAAWVIPTFNYSDHPPADLQLGQSFVANVVDSVEASPDWNSTAVFITWDDYGGYYDHVAPPHLDQYGLSFRVPLLVVSPYTPVGYVGHQFGYFESFLRMLEWKFSLPSLTSRDANAPLLLDYFNFGARRSTVNFPTNASAATYPMPLPGANAAVSVADPPSVGLPPLPGPTSAATVGAGPGSVLPGASQAPPDCLGDGYGGPTGGATTSGGSTGSACTVVHPPEVVRLGAPGVLALASTPRVEPADPGVVTSRGDGGERSRAQGQGPRTRDTPRAPPRTGAGPGTVPGTCRVSPASL